MKFVYCIIHYYQLIKPKKMKNTVGFIIILTLLLGGCNLFNKKSKEEQARLEQARIDSLAKAKADSLKRVEEAMRKKQARLDSIRQVRRAQAEKEKKRYHIIAGSFKTPSYAEKYAEKMKAEGYDTEIIQGNNNYNMVSIGAYQTMPQAARRLTSIREKGTYEVWIYNHTN